MDGIFRFFVGFEYTDPVSGNVMRFDFEDNIHRRTSQNDEVELMLHGIRAYGEDPLKTWTGNIRAFAATVVDGANTSPIPLEAKKNIFKNNPGLDYFAALNFAKLYNPDPKPGLIEREKQPQHDAFRSQPPATDKNQDKTEYTNAHGFASPAPRLPSPGGIEILALKRPSTMPKCTQIKKTGDWIWLMFDDTKYWFPLEGLHPVEVAAIEACSNTKSIHRTCVDVHISPGRYNIFIEGGLHDAAPAEVLKRADFLLAALVFGRVPEIGRLFEPKPGKLPGYKNPILEAASLLKTDRQYAAARCRYRYVWLRPTLVCDEPFSLPKSTLGDLLTWAEPKFPTKTFRLACRLTLVDPYNRVAYYDVPDVPGHIHEDAEVLLRPFKPLINAFRLHGAGWVASKPGLDKVAKYAKLHIKRTCPDWIIDNNGSDPDWWRQLHALLGPGLLFDSILAHLRYSSIPTAKAKLVAPLCLEMLVLHAAYDMLAKFEQQENIHGISSICYVLAHFFHFLPDARLVL
ncbi:hypothetical protein BGZ65_003675 [Modicella reniformis]|uniref:Uncharacterized protein n=1 Tax=Modicella reniformis TaxID=1440133 RepID=A0A9P6M300_9FUNG|nr:hypothetical protein BGZ65_003675 [Modicella reniformis]